MLSLNEAKKIAEQKSKDTVIGGIEYKECYVFSMRNASLVGNSSGYYVNKSTGKNKWKHISEPIMVNGKNIVSLKEAVRSI